LGYGTSVELKGERNRLGGRPRRSSRRCGRNRGPRG
jgi:hypothetical protein